VTRSSAGRPGVNPGPTTYSVFRSIVAPSSHRRAGSLRLVVKVQDWCSRERANDLLQARAGIHGAVFFGLAGTAAAQSPDRWFLGCKAFAEGRANTQPQLYGMQSFCSGVVHGLVAVGPLLPARLQFCPPQASTPSQLARVVVQYVEAQPERMHEDFRQLTLEAFHNAWPCKSER
jgi:hypothetical protein